MNNRQISVLLMLSLQLMSMYAAQASPQDVEYGRQTMIDNAVTSFSYLTKGFDFLRTQNLVDTTFHDFLEHNVLHDEHANEDMNFDQVIVNAEDIITENMKYRFLQTLDTALKECQRLDQFRDPVFLYVMQHKDDDMHDMARLWLYEWSKIQDKYGDIPLHYAIWRDNTEIVRILITGGADIHIKNINGKNSLQLAAYCGFNAEIVSMLLAAGAHVNIQDEYSNTPLDSAVCFNNTEIVRMLIDAGAHVNIQNKHGRTSLHEAALKDNPVIVSMLLAAGGNVNIQNKDGETPLHFAAYFGKTEIVNMFVTAGADVDIQDKHGRTATQILLEAGADIQDFRN